MWILYTLLSLLTATLLLLLFFILPGAKRNRRPFDKTLYAHRGLHSGDGQYPENSLIAFRLAREAGYGVELDVQLTADSQVVVFHDDTLLRMCGIDRRLDEFTYEELQELTLLGSDQHIPLLTEVLDVLDGATLLCELKPMRSYTDTSLCDAVLPILRNYKGSFCIESFNPIMVRWFRKNAPDVIRGFLSKRFTKDDHVAPALGVILSALLTNCLCRPDFIAYLHTDRRNPMFKLCRKLGAMAIAWTVHSPEEAADCANDFDTVIFESFLAKQEEKTFS